MCCRIDSPSATPPEGLVKEGRGMERQVGVWCQINSKFSLNQIAVECHFSKLKVLDTDRLDTT